MATYSKGTVNSLTAYSQVNGSSNTTVSLFTVSSTANVITKLDGYFGFGNSSGAFCIGPTNGGSPLSVNGTFSFASNGGAGATTFYRYNGTSYSGLTPATNSLHNRLTACVEVGTSLSGNWGIFFNDFILTPGYFVYLYSLAGGTYPYGYELKKTEVTQR